MGGTCSTVQVASGDSCASLAAKCSINSTAFNEYNPSPTLCSTLTPGEHVCCSAGSLPDYAPQPSANGTCYTYHVASGDDCSSLAASYSITVDKIGSYNNQTWGWLGCSDLQEGQNICLSSGTPPFPAPVANAVCGPQVPNTLEPTNGTSWASLNPCPLNACCDIWGECGTTADFCTATNSTTGAPGTAAVGSYGCISNCGIDIVNNLTPPAEFTSIGYFEAASVERPCLNMYAYSINESSFTHIHYAFGNITSDFQVNDGGYTEQFNYFATQLTQVKRIMSFGGWAFSTDLSTYTIFREGVTEANRQILAQNVANFIISNGLDGVDFDWEYPGAPDIPGIPPGSSDDGSNYLLFLREVRALLPSNISLAITAPASYWYLRGFPIADIAKVVNYIVFITYDLHGTWDLDSDWSQDGCPAGNCLRSDINITETMSALSMITKAGVPTNQIMVGVTSYGRSFQMSTAGCTGPECTWTAPGLAGKCTQTAGLIANAEINNIIATNPTALQLEDSPSNGDILVYNETQWVGYLGEAKKSFRAAAYKDINMGGTAEWAVDLEQFIPDTSPDDININSLQFEYRGSPECTTLQKKKIRQGWIDALTIANSAKKLADFTAPAELELSWSPQYNAGYQSYIQEILNNAATFTLDSFFEPASWVVYVTCEDWKQRCGEPGVKAYTNNVDWLTGTTELKNDPSSTMKLTLCREYFLYENLATVVDIGKQRDNSEVNKWDLNWYRNKG
jgi:GH18 family chitinase